MDASLPVEVRQALDRLPAVASADVAAIWVHGIASAGFDVCEGIIKGRETEARQTAARLAAACIRLVEYLEDRP
jgi:hypothetical protein